MTNHPLHLHPSLSPQSGTPGRPSPAVGNPCGDAPDIAARAPRGAGSAGHAVDGRHPSRVALALHPAGSAGGDTFMGRPSGVPPRSCRHASHHRVMQRSHASGRRSLPFLGAVSASAGAVLGGAGALLRHSARRYQGPLWSTPSDVLASPVSLGGETNLKPAKTTTQGHALRPWGRGVAISGDVRTPAARLCVSTDGHCWPDASTTGREGGQGPADVPAGSGPQGPDVRVGGLDTSVTAGPLSIHGVTLPAERRLVTSRRKSKGDVVARPENIGIPLAEVAERLHEKFHLFARDGEISPREMYELGQDIGTMHHQSQRVNRSIGFALRRRGRWRGRDMARAQGARAHRGHDMDRR